MTFRRSFVTGVAALTVLATTTHPGAAGTVDDAKSVLASWSAAYSRNDADAVTANYWPDAILLGTVSPVIQTGSEEIREEFGIITGSGNTNTVSEIHAIEVDENAVVLTGFYTFVRNKGGKMVPGPSRFTMLITKRNGVWHIAHHHSSPRVIAN